MKSLRNGRNIVVIEINGLTKAQEIAIEDFFAKIKDCVDGDVSRWIALFADGRNEWKNISISIDGNPPTRCDIPADCQRWWNVYFKEDENKYTPEPFYLAESYTVEQFLSQNTEMNGETDETN